MACPTGDIAAWITSVSAFVRIVERKRAAKRGFSSITDENLRKNQGRTRGLFSDDRTEDREVQVGTEVNDRAVNDEPVRCDDQFQFPGTQSSCEGWAFGLLDLLELGYGQHTFRLKDPPALFENSFCGTDLLEIVQCGRYEADVNRMVFNGYPFTYVGDDGYYVVGAFEVDPSPQRSDALLPEVNGVNLTVLSHRYCRPECVIPFAGSDVKEDRPAFHIELGEELLMVGKVVAAFA
jgi:hypothetical protein